MIKKSQNYSQKLNKKILIIGGSSFFSLGFLRESTSQYNVIASYFKNKKKVKSFNHIKIDIKNYKNLKKSIISINPDIIINAAGITNVDDCEKNYNKAYQINYLGAKNIAQICKNLKIKLVHLSTDHLFDGKKRKYTENDKITPLNNYSKSKLLAEDYIKKNLNNFLIIRTNFFGVGYNHSKKFFDFIIERLKRKKKIYLFDDVFYSPISIPRLSKIILIMLNKNAKGLFNVVSDERISKFKFGILVSKIFGLDTKLIKKDRLSNRGDLTLRPKDMSLSTKKINKFLNFSTGSVSDSILDLLPSLKKRKKESISYGRQFISNSDIKNVKDVLKSNFLTQGPKTIEFEKNFAKYVGAKYAVSVSSCSAGLLIAVKSFQLKKNLGMITSPNTFVSTANSALYNNLKVILSDIDENTGCMSANKLKKTLRKFGNAKIIMPVHFAGNVCDMKKIQRIAKKKNIYIIEDAAHALGSKYDKNNMVGSCKYSDMTVFSFHPVKTITTGEGGMITTNNYQLYKKLILLRSHGIEKFPSYFINKSKFKKSIFNENKWYYEMQIPGYHFRLTDIQSALGVSQLKKVNSFLKKRSQITKIYDQMFKENRIIKIFKNKSNQSSSNHLYVIRVNFKKISKNKSQLMEFLSFHGFNTQVHYIPLYYHPYLKNKVFNAPSCISMERYYNEALSIPIYYSLKKKEQIEVSELIKNFINQFR